MRTIIMAQGVGKRLAKIVTRKQFLEVGGEPIVGRTLRQLAERGHCSPLVVSWPDMHRRLLSLGASVVALDEPGFCVVDGIRQTQRFWTTAVLLLLGDVVFSNNALEAILSRIDETPDELFFALSPDMNRGGGEIFALYIPDDNSAAKEAVENVECRGINTCSVYQPGHLRNLLWHIMGRRSLTPNHTTARGEFHSSLALVIDDWTNDIDKPEDIWNLLPKLNHQVREENSRTGNLFVTTTAPSE